MARVKAGRNGEDGGREKGRLSDRGKGVGQSDVDYREEGMAVFNEADYGQIWRET